MEEIIPWLVAFVCIPVFLFCPALWCSSCEVLELILRHVPAEVGIIMVTTIRSMLPEVVNPVLYLGSCSDNQSMPLLYFPVWIWIIWIMELNFVVYLHFMEVCLGITPVVIHNFGMSRLVREEVFEEY